MVVEEQIACNYKQAELIRRLQATIDRQNREIIKLKESLRKTINRALDAELKWSKL